MVGVYWDWVRVGLACVAKPVCFLWLLIMDTSIHIPPYLVVDLISLISNYGNSTIFFYQHLTFYTLLHTVDHKHFMLKIFRSGKFHCIKFRS